MSYVFKTYGELKEAFKASSESFLQRHDCEDIEGLPEPRKSQMNFLISSIESLENQSSLAYSDDIKAQVLTGFLYLIREHIRDTYTVSYPTNSHLFTELGNCLGLDGLDTIPTHDLLTALTKTLTYLKNNVLESTQEPEGFKDDHPYTACEPLLLEVWNLLANRTYSVIFDMCHMNFEISQKKKASGAPSVTTISMFLAECENEAGAARATQEEGKRPSQF